MDTLIVMLMSYIPSFAFVGESRHILATEKHLFSGSKEGLLEMIVNIFQTWNNICETSWTMKSFSLFCWVCRLILKSLQHFLFSLVGSILISMEIFRFEGANSFFWDFVTTSEKWSELIYVWRILQTFSASHLSEQYLQIIFTCHELALSI